MITRADAELLEPADHVGRWLSQCVLKRVDPDDRILVGDNRNRFALALQPLNLPGHFVADHDPPLGEEVDVAYKIGRAVDLSRQPEPWDFLHVDGLPELDAALLGGSDDGAGQGVFRPALE